MKKNMIAAASVALVGGAFAAGYDFSAYVKTTKAKSGSQTSTYYVNLGQNKDLSGQYWWEADPVKEGWTSEKEAKADVAAWVKAANKNGFDGSALEKFLGAINYTASTDRDNGENDFGLAEVYKQKLRWCYSFSFKVTTTDCYRVAGSRKITGSVYIDKCCDVSGAIVPWKYEAGDDVTLAVAVDGVCDGYITPGLLVRFGGLGAKADKVEMAGVAGCSVFDGACKAINVFALAGQGAVDTNNEIIKNISGNIVGVLDDPECESCCAADKAAQFYACDGLWSEDAGADNPLTVSTDYGTAAFGTWSMKYNKRYDNN